jgi:hypothetical protein
MVLIVKYLGITLGWLHLQPRSLEDARGSFTVLPRRGGYMSAHACSIVVAALHLIVASLTSRMMASSNEMKMYDG